MNDFPRLIEHAFPLKQTSLDSVHEKNVRHGHISTLHIWPARRPLAACRAALIATLLPDPGTAEGRKALCEKIAGHVVRRIEKKKMPNGQTVERIKEETEGGILHWGRETENAEALEWFRQEIRKAYGGRAPKVLDPFAGGGAIPLEAMRLGCEATAVDINPVAWFILKCTLEYPQRLAGQTRPLPDFILKNEVFMEACAMREGVDDYLPKPFSDEELRHAVAAALDKVRQRREIEAPGPVEAPDGLIGASAAMQRVYRLIARAASASVPVLITGESGTGKELVARAIHYRGPRASAPFLAVNCAAIPETLIESELFGHAKGSFTGATAARQGFFVAADGGTLFLDEVAELSPIAQAKLLRVLQEQTVQAVGSDQPRTVDVRVIAATNKDLEGLAREGGGREGGGKFREDLFFRLHVLPIEVPPLREREGDVVPLLRHFLAAAAEQSSTPVPHVTDGAVEALRRYSWPGNVRELQNLTQRLVIFADAGVIDTVDLPTVIRYVAQAPDTQSEPPGWGHRTLREVELAHIRAVLESVGGNKTRAAAILGIDRKSLREKLNAAESARAHRGDGQSGADV